MFAHVSLWSPPSADDVDDMGRASTRGRARDGVTTGIDVVVAASAASRGVECAGTIRSQDSVHV